MKERGSIYDHFALSGSAWGAIWGRLSKNYFCQENVFMQKIKLQENKPKACGGGGASPTKQKQNIYIYIYINIYVFIFLFLSGGGHVSPTSRGLVFLELHIYFSDTRFSPKNSFFESRPHMAPQADPLRAKRPYIDPLSIRFPSKKLTLTVRNQHF